MLRLICQFGTLCWFIQNTKFWYFISYQLKGSVYEGEYITKTRLFKYIEHFTAQKENFQIKKSDIFNISAQNIDCGYSLEPPRRGGSNVYPQSMF